MAEKPESKKPKPELIAIFRLEFYKKQKNWKFCQDVRGKTPPDTPEKEQTKHILNKTYNIDTKPEPGAGGEGDQGEEVSELNQAFCDAGSDRNTQDWDRPTTPTTVPSQVWYNTAHMQTQQEPDWDEQIYQNPDKFQDNIWHDALQEWYPSPEYTAQAPTDLNYNLSSWPTHTQLWADRHAADNMDYSEVGPQIVDLDIGSCQEQGSGGGGEPGSTCLSQSWLEHKHWPTPATTFHTSQSEVSLESLAEFVRGAADVPHSSEVDLALATDETYKRSALIFEGCDDYPTRDTEPSYGTHDFVAGSFMNVAEGRGRGRLRGERVIRIGMGRPYRL